MAKNFPNLGKEKDIHVQEAQKVPNKTNSVRPTARHIVDKWQELNKKRQSSRKQARKK